MATPLTNLMLPNLFANLEARPHLDFLVVYQKTERARPHNRDHVANYDRVLLELADVEARSVRWRSGFYEAQHSRKEVIDILGEPNLPGEDAVTEQDREGTASDT